MICSYSIHLVWLILIFKLHRRTRFTLRFSIHSLKIRMASYPCNKYDYNIPTACLLNRSPVPAMDLKSNRSGLWRHMSRTCRELRKLCCKRSKYVARHDKTPVKSTLLSHDKNILLRDMSFMSRRSDIMLWLLHILKLRYMHCKFAFFHIVAT